MRQPSIYFETTILNSPFADAPHFQADTQVLFSNIKDGLFKPFTSDYVIRELELTKNIEKLKKMKTVISDLNVALVPANSEAERLAEVYVSAGIIPLKYKTDALHIAAATVAGLDFIISLNFKHIVKHKTIIETEIVNAREGFKRVFIHTPAEVIYRDEDN